MERPPILFNRLQSSSELASNVIGSALLVESGTVAYAAGMFGDAISLVGTGNIEDLSFTWPTGSWAIEAWIFATGSNAVKRWFTNVDGNGLSTDFWLRETGAGFLNIWDGQVETTTATSVNRNVWDHYALVWDDPNTTITAFKNNSSFYSNNAGASPTWKSELYIGGKNGSGERFDGKIDNIKIYDYLKNDFNDRFNERAGMNDQVMAA